MERHMISETMSERHMIHWFWMMTTWEQQRIGRLTAVVVERARRVLRNVDLHSYL